MQMSGQVPNGSISGAFVDSITAQPIEYAAVSVRQAGGTSVLLSGMTDSAGRFDFQHMAYGSYMLECSYLGYKKKSIPITLSKNKPVYQFNKIMLSPSANQLAEAVVVGEKPVIRFEAGKVTFDVGKSVTDGAETIMETLEKIPGVSVTQDGAVTVKGKSEIRYLVDGKPSPLAQANPEAFLKSISAKNIESIEVITSPSAKYDAAGSGAVINIKLKKGKLEGINGSVSAGIGTVANKGNTSGNINYKKGKFNVFANGYYRNEKTWNTSSEDRTVNTDNIISHFYTDGTGTNHTQNGGGRTGIEYAIDKHHSVSYNLGGGYNANQRTSMGTMTVDDPATPALSLRTSQSPIAYSSINFSNSLNYRQTYDSADHEWTIDLIHSINKDDRTGVNSSIASDISGRELDSLDFYKRTNTAGFNQNLILQTDYTVPMKKAKAKVETGFKEELNLYNNNNVVYSNAEEPQVPDTIQSNRFKYTQSVTAAYVTYSESLKKFSYTGGLRWENTYIYSEQSKVNQNYASLFPSGSIGWRFTDRHSISISYGRRIDRPPFWMLNNTVSYNSPYSVWQGNPELKPAFTNNAELGYNAWIDKQSFGANVSYSHTNNTFQSLNHTDSDQVTHSSMQNAGTKDNTGVFAYSNLKFFTWWDASISAGYSYHWYSYMQDGTAYHTAGGEANFWVNTTLKFWKNASFSVNGWGNTGWVEAQKRSKPVGNITMTLKKKFFKDKLTVSISCRDVFHTQQWRSTTITDQLYVYSQYSSETRVGYLTLTYQFGKTTFTPEGKSKAGADDGEASGEKR